MIFGCNKGCKSRDSLIYTLPFCGERGIRTLETLSTFTRFPGVPLQPLEHLSFFRMSCGGSSFTAYVRQRYQKFVYVCKSERMCRKERPFLANSYFDVPGETERSQRKDREATCYFRRTCPGVALVLRALRKTEFFARKRPSCKGFGAGAGLDLVQTGRKI